MKKKTAKSTNKSTKKKENQSDVLAIKSMALGQCILMEKRKKELEGLPKGSEEKEREELRTEILGEGASATGLLIAVAVGCGDGGKEWAWDCAKQFGLAQVVTQSLGDLKRVVDHAAESESGRKVFEGFGISLNSDVANG